MDFLNQPFISINWGYAYTRVDRHLDVGRKDHLHIINFGVTTCLPPFRQFRFVTNTCIGLAALGAKHPRAVDFAFTSIQSRFP